MHHFDKINNNQHPLELIPFMRKRIFFLLLPIALLNLSGCTTEDPYADQFIRVSDHSSLGPDISVIKDEKDISEIMKLMDQVSWNSQTDIPDRDEDYQFWLEKEDNEERLAVYEVWFEGDQSIIFDSKKRKAGYLERSDAEKLEHYFTSGSKKQ